MVKRIKSYKNMDIDEVTDAPLNNMFRSAVMYHACKLDFSQPMNYLDIYGKTLNECKAKVDLHFNGRM